MSFEYFLKAYYPPFIVLLGLIGNFIVILVFSSKKMSSLTISKFVVVMSISDTLGLVQILQQFFDYVFDLNVRKFSDFSCKLFVYLTYVFGPISAWTHVYISFERFFSIRFPTRSAFLKNKCLQNIVVLIILFFNLSLYLPFFYFLNLKLVMHSEGYMNQSNSYVCDIDLNAAQIIQTVDFLNSTALPFSIMFLNTFLLLYTVFKSRYKILNKSKKTKASKQKKKDLQFGITSISLNFTFLILNLPYCIFILFFQSDSIINFLIVNNMFFTSFSTQFFIHLFSNRFFRSEFLQLFRKNVNGKRIIDQGKVKKFASIKKSRL